MKQTLWTLATATAAINIFTVSNAYAGSDPIGFWTNDTGRGAVEIKACGNALCGHVVAVKDDTDTKGCGKQIIGDAQPAGGGTWDNGWIYSPEKRKNYDVELTPLKDGTLRVVGYAGTKLFSRTMIWTRGTGNLKACGSLEAKTIPAPAQDTQSAAIKPAAPATVAIPTPPASVAIASPPAAPAPVAAADAPAKTVASPPVAAEGTKPATAPAAKTETAVANSAEADASNTSETDGEKPGQRKKRGGLKLGGIDLDSVLTRTKSGRCKLDLPWVKVHFECDRN